MSALKNGMGDDYFLDINDIEFTFTRIAEIFIKALPVLIRAMKSLALDIMS